MKKILAASAVIALFATAASAQSLSPSPSEIGTGVSPGLQSGSDAVGNASILPSDSDAQASAPLTGNGVDAGRTGSVGGNGQALQNPSTSPTAPGISGGFASQPNGGRGGVAGTGGSSN